MLTIALEVWIALMEEVEFRDLGTILLSLRELFLDTFQSSCSDVMCVELNFVV